jgi:hypothetical protein
MKRILMCAMMLALLLTMTDPILAQGRKSQIELYAGAGFPLGPDAFKDFYKIGLSGNAQYVFFPSPNLGIPIFVGYERFTVDTDAISNLFVTGLESGLVGTGIDLVSADFSSEGSASTLKLGIGVRPYLTQPEAPTQFFLFGSGTFNLLKASYEFTGGTYTLRDTFTGDQQSFTITPDDFRASGIEPSVEGDDEKFGLAGGAGIELPAGESLNLIFQGLFNIIFTEDESTTFLGVTAGIIF